MPHSPLLPDTRRPPLVLNQEQIACLTSPLKREIFEALLMTGPASITELTAYMGRSPKSLYYHVRQLCAAGLIQILETRRAGKRQEAVYEPVSDRIHITEEATDDAYRQTAFQANRALLRKIERELRPAAAAENGRDVSDVQVLRVIVWLKPEARTQLETMLEEVARFLREQDDPQNGERTALTTFVTTQHQQGTAKNTRNQAGTSDQ